MRAKPRDKTLVVNGVAAELTVVSIAITSAERDGIAAAVREALPESELKSTSNANEPTRQEFTLFGRRVVVNSTSNATQVATSIVAAVNEKYGPMCIVTSTGKLKNLRPEPPDETAS